MSHTALEPNMTFCYCGESRGRVLRPGDKFYLEGLLVTFRGIDGDRLLLADRLGEWEKVVLTSIAGVKP
ncbi:hypothetical protein [Streptomyces chartreusis]|uniref:hypothetical protein n=1 Tax=Streptomyces chartreusis TaxID=1969 RepID=UPI00367BBACD